MVSQTVPYTYLEHTADVGIEVEAASLEQLFDSAAKGLTSIFIDISSAHHTDSKNIYIVASDIETLLFRWLNEILFLFDAEKFICIDVPSITISSSDEGMSLDANVQGAIFDHSIHEVHTYVKAVTYYNFEITHVNEKYIARFYVDV